MKISIALISFSFLIGSLRADEPLSTASLARLNFEQHLGSALSLDTPFLDEYGNTTQLGQCLNSGPTILALGYYECPMLCNLVLNGIIHSLQEVQSQKSDEPTVLFISIDPKETPSLALSKKLACLKRYGHPRAESRWHFLTGTGPNARRVAEQVGFPYLYDPVNKQYAHPSGIIILTQKGAISQYFFGVTYSPSDLSKALQRARAGGAGNPTPRLLMLCSKFMTLTGRHSLAVLNSVRALAILSIGALVGLLVVSTRRAGKQTP